MKNIQNEDSTQNADLASDRHSRGDDQPQVAAYITRDVELDLFELLGALWGKRNIVLVVFSIAMLLSFAKLYFSVPVYQASIHFLPPTEIDMSSLNTEGLGNSYTVEKVYKKFRYNYSRRDNLWKYFIERKLYAAYLDGDSNNGTDINRAFQNGFLEDISFKNDSSEQNDLPYFEATIKWQSAEEAPILLNDYSQFVLDSTSRELVAETEHAREVKIEQIENDISALRKVSIELKQWRLAALEENISIARRLGLKNSVAFSDNDESTIKSNSSEFPYLLGFEVLEVEKDVLLKRDNNDPFTPGLETLIKKLATLGAQAVPKESIRVARVSQAAVFNPIPVEPKAKVIILLGASFGLFAGVFLALMSVAYSRRRD